MQQLIQENHPSIILCPITLLGEYDFESIVDGKIYECKKSNLIAVVVSSTQMVVIKS